VLGHLHVRVPHQALNVSLLDTLLLVQSCTERADLVEGRALTRRHFFVSLGDPGPHSTTLRGSLPWLRSKSAIRRLTDSRLPKTISDQTTRPL
jgi:hypothetical protein